MKKCFYIHIPANNRFTCKLPACCLSCWEYQCISNHFKKQILWNNVKLAEWQFLARFSGQFFVLVSMQLSERFTRFNMVMQHLLETEKKGFFGFKGSIVSSYSHHHKSSSVSTLSVIKSKNWLKIWQYDNGTMKVLDWKVWLMKNIRQVWNKGRKSSWIKCYCQ